MPQNFSKFEHGTEVDGITKIDEPEEENRVAKIFNGHVILITGATGYLGKVLLEKLLRTCPGLKKVYVIIRSKKDKTAQDRLHHDILKSELFDLLKSEPHGKAALEKVEAIPGDVSLPGLGISPEDRKRLIDQVTIIYHSAATVRFDEEVRVSILVNTRGTKLMLELAKQCKNLQLFAHVSTAYSHPEHQLIKEQAYDPPADPDKMIAASECLDENVMRHIEQRLLGEIPNSYTLTKAMAEELVVRSFSELPAVIYRPSIVLPIWKQPIPGWTDNVNGPLGLLIAAAKGVLRTMYCDPNIYADYVPADFVADAMLVSTWNSLTTKDFSQRVVNMISSNEMKITWGELIESGRYVTEYRVPLNGIAWYHGGFPKANFYIHKFCLIFFMWVPAFLGDILIWCFRQKPILCRVQRKLSKGMVVLEYYCNHQWRFENAELVKYRKLLNKREKEMYAIDTTGLDLVKYLENFVYSFRRYILKTPDEMIPAARKQMKIMYCVDKTFKFLLSVWILYIIYCKIIYPYVPHEDSTDAIVEEIINGTV